MESYHKMINPNSFEANIIVIVTLCPHTERVKQNTQYIFAGMFASLLRSHEYASDYVDNVVVRSQIISYVMNTRVQDTKVIYLYIIWYIYHNEWKRFYNSD